MQEMIMIFDTETTTLFKDRSMTLQYKNIDEYPYATQISAICFNRKTGQIIKSLNSFVKKPFEIKIDPIAEKITGISDTICETNGKPICDILIALYEIYISSSFVVAHNLEFDCKIILTELMRNRDKLPQYCMKMFQSKYNPNTHHLCTMKMSLKNPRDKYPKLIELYTRFFGFSLPKQYNTHNSIVDVIICLRCFLKLKFDEPISDEYFNDLFAQCFRETQNLRCSVSSRTRHQEMNLFKKGSDQNSSDFVQPKKTCLTIPIIT
jgi:DNA polymerase III epsilon subunit-like protein